MARGCGSFIESEGAGVHLLAMARLALVMGLAIHGIIVLTQIATDKAGCSIPTPDKGILTAASEWPLRLDPPLLRSRVGRAARRRRCLELAMATLSMEKKKMGYRQSDRYTFG